MIGGSYRVAGIWHCQGCQTSDRQFVSDDPNCSDPDFFRCLDCGYQYGKNINMAGKTPAERVVGRLSKAVVAEGARRFREQETARRSWAGIPLSTPAEIRKERHRRGGF